MEWKEYNDGERETVANVVVGGGKKKIGEAAAVGDEGVASTAGGGVGGVGGVGESKLGPLYRSAPAFQLGKEEGGKKGERRNHMTEKKATRLYIPRTAHSRPGKDLWSASV